MGGCYSSRFKEQKRQKASVSAWNGMDRQAGSNKGQPGEQFLKNGNVERHMLKEGVDLDNVSPHRSICSGVSKREDTSGCFSLESKEEEWYDSRAFLVADSDDEYSSMVGGDTPVFSPSLTSSPQPQNSFVKEGMLRREGSCPSKSDNAPASVEFHDGRDNDPSRTGPNLQFLYNDTKAEMQREVPTLGATVLMSMKHVVVSATENDEANKDRLPHDHSEKDTSEGSCLPCLANGMIFNDKKKITTSPSHSQRKKASQLFPLKLRTSLDTNQDAGILKETLKMPQAGKQVPYSVDSKEGCWSNFSPSSFKLRAPNYLRDRRKQPAPPQAIYEALGVDVFLSEKKINHIANVVELPFQHLACDGEEIPTLFIFNIQVPLYPASIFSAENDGKGLSLVYYFKLSESFKKEAPEYLKEMLKKLINNDMEKVKGLVGDTILPFRDRLKIVARVCNPDEIQLSAAERRLVVTYNEKPVLSRPQHLFYKGSNYFEVDLDVHRFNFIARKAVEAFRERLKLCVLDIGLTIQVNRPEELPEYLLCGLRVNKLDVAMFHYLNTETRCQETSLESLRSATD